MALEPDGVARRVDWAGFEQVNWNLTIQSDIILRNMLAVISTNGDMATVGVYSHEHGNIASQSQASTIQTHFNLSLADFSGAADFSGGLVFHGPWLLHHSFYIWSARPKPD